MSQLRLFTGNRLDRLADALSETLASPSGSPFDPEVVVVQSKGMERWLSMCLASRLGICANVRFPFPNTFVHDVFRAVLPGVPEESPFDRDLMTWKIMKILPELATGPGFEDIRHYLAGRDADLKRLQLARRIADTFDQYLLYRPKMILDWQTTPDRDRQWQAELWRAIARGHETEHRPAMGKAFFERVDAMAPGSAPFPRRVAVFGISSLPPFHVRVLEAVARHVEVNLFLLSPCREYWGDIASESRIGKAILRQSAADAPEVLHYEVGNPLLASLGTLGRDFFEILQDSPFRETARHFEDPGEATLLSTLQSDILNLRHRGAGSGCGAKAGWPAACPDGVEADRSRGADIGAGDGIDGGADEPTDEGRPPRGIIPDGDVSLLIHSCHGPMREVEVLHDVLLDAFERDPGLHPRDVLVMAPDIESYAPYVAAVFDSPEDERRRIPYGVADRSLRRESRMAEAFLRVLDLRESRFKAPRVLEVLEFEPVRRRFDISESDLPLIRRWVSETRIRWGIDADWKTERVGVGFAENTWRAGLDRLVLGYALPGDGERLFAGILPHDAIEGSEATVLGNVMAFTDRLFALAGELDAPRTPAAWASFLKGLLADLCAPEAEDSRDATLLKRELDALSVVEEAADFRDPIDLDLVRWLLRARLEHQGFGSGFLSGGVTFCSMLPMRSIPFKFIALLGMNDASYPRNPKAPAFDLMAREPRPGDRSPRNDDRYLFLEALISAGSRLHISHTGQSPRDNSVIPPSVVVSELMDTIREGFQSASGDADRFLVKHRLQPFSPDYFQAGAGDTGGGAKSPQLPFVKAAPPPSPFPGLFSYSKSNLETARRLVAPRSRPEPFFAAPLAEPVEASSALSIDDLAAFFDNPCRHLLRRVLGLRFPNEDSVPDESENFSLAGLDRYQVEERMLETGLDGRDTTPLADLARASGVLPHGVPGECAFDRSARSVRAFVARTLPLAGAPLADHLDLETTAAGVSISGRVGPVREGGLFFARHGTLRAVDYLRAWLRHLLLCAVPPGDIPAGIPRRTLLVGLNRRQFAAVAFKAVDPDRCAFLLADLLALRREGLTRPLPFFPKASFAHAGQMRAGKGEARAVEAARREWEGNEFHHIPGERDDPWFDLCFRSGDPFGGDEESPPDEALARDFERVSLAVFLPLLEHLGDPS